MGHYSEQVKIGKNPGKEDNVPEFSIIFQFLYLDLCFFGFLVCKRNKSSHLKSLSIVFKMSLYGFIHFLISLAKKYMSTTKWL